MDVNKWQQRLCHAGVPLFDKDGVHFRYGPRSLQSPIDFSWYINTLICLFSPICFCLPRSAIPTMSLPISLPTEAMRTREFLDCLSDLVMREAQDILHLSKTTIYRMRIDAGLEKTWPYRSICKNHHPTLTWASITRTRDRLINTSSDVLVRLVLVRVKSAALANRIFNDKDFLTTQPNNTSLIHKTFFEVYKQYDRNSLNYQSVLMKPDGSSSVATFASAVLCFNPQPETDEQYNQRLANALLGDDAPATLVAPDTTLTTATDYEWITTTGTTPSMFKHFYSHYEEPDTDWIFAEPEPANATTEPSP